MKQRVYRLGGAIEKKSSNYKEVILMNLLRVFMMANEGVMAEESQICSNAVTSEMITPFAIMG